VFKLKRDTNGQITSCKARLVARGFTQEMGVDYHETFAPTVRVISIRTLLALAAYNDWEQLHVVTAFLEADIEEEVYMRQPEGFRHTDINGEERVCLLKKSLYGLKQAPRSMASG
jgi:stage V sporulation protein SpoVS